jgi:uncharacterized protein
VMILLALGCAALSFMLSAAAGLGGSLILVPVLGLLLGAKQGIAVAAILLGCNNIAKVLAYRRTIPLRAALGVLALTVVGTAIGAQLLIAAPERWVTAAIVLTLGVSFLVEHKQLQRLRRASSPLLAFFAGATSGFSGTSGPLKGVALRNLGLDRLHLVGAASVVSLAGDAMKAVIFTQAALIDATSFLLIFGAIPVMPLATVAGRYLNRRIGEQAYRILFWSVIAGYSIRLLPV